MIYKERSNDVKIKKCLIEDDIRMGIAQGLSDTEMAEVIGKKYGVRLGTSTISYWRARFKINPADKFIRKFQKKYGVNDDAMQRFRDLVKARTPLGEIGLEFGFSQEYARQVVMKIYGKPYRELLKSFPN